MYLLSPFLQIYNYSLQPIPPFTWFGSPISTLDVIAAFRLCIVLRPIREINYAQHVSKHGESTVEQPSFLRRLITTLTVVYGGEAITGSSNINIVCPIIPDHRARPVVGVHTFVRH